MLQRLLEFNPPSTRFERVNFMYDNSTPNDGQTSSSRGNLVEATETNPCPHCGKPDWCYFIGELSVCNRPQYPPAAGWEATSKTDKDGKIYYAPIREKKAIRPRQTRYWEYPARDGSPLVRVVRFDDGEGGGGGDKKKPAWHQERWNISKIKNKNGWVPGIEGIAREDIPIYRYAEIQKAIERNELIFIVEGEACADILWKLGLAATCNIGGSEKWRSSDTSDLQGARIVIVPDRDQPGIKHAELLHQEFPDALWLYPFPNSKAWQNLPKSKGLDIADWIEQHQITADDIRAAIGDKKVFKAPAPEAAANVIRPPQFQVPPTYELGEEIDKLLESDLRKSQLQLKISELAQKYRIPSADVWKIYREREQEQEQEADRPDVATEIESLLSAHKSSIALTEVLPSGLAQPIEKLATMLNLRAECYLAALLTQVSSLFKVGTETVLRRDTDWRCVPNYFAGMVAEVSQLKTPVPKAIIDRPMRALEKKHRRSLSKPK
jgi:CRISPR-associated protein Cmr3